MKKPRITVLLGTGREGRQSAHVAAYIMSIAEQRDTASYQYVDVRDYLYGATEAGVDTNEDIPTWKSIVAQTDAFLFVVPEYNHGYPGELKILLDQEYELYKGKPVIIAGVSSGRIGGARVVDHIQSVLSTLGYIYIPAPLLFPEVESLFDADGHILESTYEKRVVRSLETLEVYTRALEGVQETLSHIS